MTKRTLYRVPIVETILLVVLLSLGGCASQSLHRQTSSCGILKDSILVDTNEKRMWLCQGGQQVEEYKIAIGRGGVGKKEKDDNKTPLGHYPLGTPRESEDKKFKKFIPVGYPTPTQQAQGFTGGDIGIHGPWRWVSGLGGIGLGSLTTMVNWTRGCIAVGSNEEIENIEKWINQNHINNVFVQ